MLINTLLSTFPVTLSIVGISAIVSLLAYFVNSSLYEKLILHPVEIKGFKFFTILSSAALYGDLKYLAVSMISLLSFGYLLEISIGHYWFLLLFLSITILSNLFLFFRHRNNPKFFKLSASGAIIGSIACALMLNPFASIPVFGFNLSAGIIALIYIGFLYYVITARIDNVSHEATLFGAVLGLVFAVGFLMFF